MPAPRGAGALRQKVRFERRADIGGDGYGNTEEGWEPLGVERSCSLTPTRGGETIQAGRLAGSASWDLWVRADSGTRTVQEGDRVVERIPGPGGARVDGQAFNVRFGPSDMEGRGAWLFLQLESGVADG